MPISEGARLGPYQILGPLGAGGMGEVYRAHDERLKRDVAIKVLPASFAQHADRLRRFEQEAQAAEPGDAVLGSAGKDGVVWMRRGGRGKIPVRVVRFDLWTGKEEPWRELAPADATGIVDFLGVQVTPDGRSYAFSYGRQLSDLYAIEGLK